MSCHTTMSHGKTYIVRRLDGVDQDVSVDKKATGGVLLEKVRVCMCNGTQRSAKSVYALYDGGCASILYMAKAPELDNKYTFQRRCCRNSMCRMRERVVDGTGAACLGWSGEPYTCNLI